MSADRRDVASPSRRGVLAGTLALPGLAAGRRDGDDLAAFYARWIPRARALAAEERPDEDAFLWELGADVARREAGFFPKRRVTVYSGEGLETGPVGSDDVFQIVELVLAPDARVPAHNHVAYAFLTLCVEGEVRVRGYEPEPGAPGPQDLERDLTVRAVQDLLLRPRLFSTLTRTRANVHALVAGPKGARLMDFGVKFPPSDVGPRAFSVLEVDPEPTDAERVLHTARWIGNVYAKDYRRAK